MSISPRLFGSFLVAIGILTAEQREHILFVMQQDEQNCFYQVALNLGYIERGEIDRYLEQVGGLSDDAYSAQKVLKPE